MQPQPDDEMQLLYKRFVKSLARGSDLSAFSEDDLLDIYDYTRSIPDDYVAMEVLIAGLHMYPASEHLAKRKVLFFHDFEQDNAVLASAAMLPSDSLVRAIAQLKINVPADASIATDSLKQILSRCPDGSVEDGDVYFLIETFNDLGMVDIVSDNAGAICRKCVYPATLEQELYKIYSEKGDSERAIRHCQALTTLQPFDPHSWEELTNAYINLSDDHEAAIEAADYALALAPESIELKVLKATVLSSTDKEAARKLCHEALDADADCRPALYLDAYLHFALGSKEAAMQSLHRYILLLDENPDRGLFDMLFENVPEEIPADMLMLLDGYVATLDSSDIYLWALSLCESNLVTGAVSVLESAFKAQKFRNHTLAVRLLAEAYYRLDRYDRVTDFIESLNDQELQNDLLLTLIYGLARYSLGMTDGLRQLLEQRLTASTLVVIDGLTGSERNMMLRGVRHYLVYLMRAIDGDDIPRMAFDPFAE